MNKNDRKLELAVDNLAMMLEALEEYIRRADYYSDWTSKEQFYRRTMPGDNNSKKYFVEKAEDHFFSQLFCFYCSTNRKSESLRKETQKEFYKWIDYSGITAENCPEKLKHYLNEINEILENCGRGFYQARRKDLYKEWGFELDLKNPLHYQAYLEVNKSFGFDGPNERPVEEPKRYEVKIKGNAERGQVTFQQIKNLITGEYEWNFTLSEKYFWQLKEKIKELEEKRDRPQPKEEWKREINLESFDEHTLMSLELYIQKLDYYPNWKIREWTKKDREDWRKNWENKTAEEVKGLVLVDLKGTSLMLRQFKNDDPNYYPILLSELKTKFSQWKSERKIDPSNCPDQLKQVLCEVNEILEGRPGNIWKKWKNSKDNEEIAKIIVEVKLKIAELKKECKINLGPEFSNWENKIMSSKSISEAKSYQQQIEQKVQAEKTKNQNANTNEDKLSSPIKIALGVGAIGLVFAITCLVYRVIKNQKVKK